MLQKYKIVVVGAGGVGKSALTLQLFNNHFIEFYDPTIEDSYRMQKEVDGVVRVLDVLDTAGQEGFSAMRDEYLSTGHGFLCVYSITDRQSFQELLVICRRILRVKETEEDVPMVIVGNKRDLGDEEAKELPSCREVSPAEGEEFAAMFAGSAFLETSAKERINVEESFFELVRRIDAYEERRMRNPPPLSPHRRHHQPDGGRGNRRRTCILF